MARTFQNVLDRARTPLNDDAKTRYSDPLLLGFANDGILLLRSQRPDLFFGSYTTLPGTEYAVGATLPVGDELMPALADYVTARALFGEDEASLQAQAKSFYDLAAGAL